MHIPYFSPIHPNPLIKENCSALRFTTRVFDLGQKSYKIECYNPQENITGVIESARKPSWLEIAVRIIAIFTVIIPLLMLIGLLIYRNANNFDISPNRLNQLPEEVYQNILSKTGYASLQLAATSKENNILAKKSDWYKTGCSVFKKIIDNGRDKKTQKFIAKTIANSNITLAIDMLKKVGYTLSKNVYATILSSVDFSDKNTVIELQRAYSTFNEDERSKALICFARVYALSNLSGALDMIETFRSELKFVASFLIADDIVKSKPAQERAAALKSILNRISSDDPPSVLLKIYLVAWLDLAKAIRMTKTCVSEMKISALSIMVKAAAISDPQKALEIANKALKHVYRADLSKDYFIKPIAKSIASFNPERAQEIAANNNDTLASIAKVIAASDLGKALAIVNTIQDIQHKTRALKSIINGIGLGDLEEAMTKTLAILNGNNLSIALAAFSKVIARSNFKKALEIANAILEPGFKAQALASVVKAIRFTDPEKALQEANAIQSDEYKAKALAAVALYIEDVKRALEIASSIEKKNYRSRAFASIAFRG